jgi:hypothetical protein
MNTKYENIGCLKKAVDQLADEHLSQVLGTVEALYFAQHGKEVQQQCPSKTESANYDKGKSCGVYS